METSENRLELTKKLILFRVLVRIPIHLLIFFLNTIDHCEIADQVIKVIIR